MINKNINFKICLFLLFTFLIIFFSNSHFTFVETLTYGGADGASYLSISKASPNITLDKMMPIHSERFFFPYFIGLLSKIFNFEIFYLYKIFVLITLILTNFYLYKIFKLIKIDNQMVFLVLSIINFNPYFSRFYIAVPTIINDLFLILGFTVVIYNIIKPKVNNSSLLIGSAISFASRQTSIALVIAYLTVYFFLKKRIINFKYEIYILILFVLFLIMSFYYSSHTFDNQSYRQELYSFETRVLGLFLQKTSLNEKLIFLLFPFLSYGPLIIFFVLFRRFNFNLKELVKSGKVTYLIILTTLVFLQPVLSGPEITGRNIIRLTTLGISPFVVLIFLITKERNFKFKKFKLTILFYIIIFFHSFHPTFSNIDIFEFLKINS